MFSQIMEGLIQPWKLSVLTFLIVLCAVYLFKMNRWEKDSTVKHQEFLAEAEARFGYGKAVPTKEIHAYDTFKEETYKNVKDTLAKGAPCQEGPEITSNSWMRKLGMAENKAHERDHQRFCVLLIQRAVANMPRYQLIQKDLKPKFMLYQKKLITETQWQMMQQAQQALGLELNFIRSEAEKLKEGWSKDDIIFQEAANIGAQLRKQIEERANFRSNSAPGSQ
eukprot:GHVH01007999.1.p2 GENE.GHVH01007999.1~~GHVH01007999.1.p2  ORF type:complete len:223 (+),score=35.84 GHVH01007999.1:958-1626(+)